MARKKIKNKDKREVPEEKVSFLKEETVEAITAIVFLAIAAFLSFAAFGRGGFLGDAVFKISNYLFGIGYYLLPVILFSLGVSFLASLKHNLAIPKIIGAVFIFISGLGIVDLIFHKGGLIGNLISTLLEKLLDFWVSLIVLFSILLISILVIFNLSLKFDFNKLFSKKEKDLSDKEDEILTKGIEKNIPEEVEDDEDDAQVPVVSSAPVVAQNSKPSGLIFFAKRSAQQTFTPPPLSLLQKDSGKPEVGDVKANANIIKRTLSNFGIQVEMDEVSIGPSITRYALKPAEGVKLSRIIALQNDLSLALAAHPLRVEAPIPGKSLVGIEIPNSIKTTVGLGSLIKDPAFNDPSKPLSVCLGKGITGKATIANFAKMPHVLIAGTTGSGKSVTIHAVITSLLYKNHPDQLKFIMVDPKRVELTLYNKIPHLLTPVITDAKKAILALKWAAKEMDRRYDLLEEHSVRDIQSYHSNILEPALKASKNDTETEVPETMPYIVVIIDELADIMQAYPRELESAIVRLAQMSRAVGIHLLISTQRPSVNVITGLIKANIPTRVALQVASQIDSRTILDMPGAEKLLGAGDMLYLSGDMSQPIRLQSAFITEKEVKDVVEWLQNQYKDVIGLSDINLGGDANNDVNPMDAIAAAGGFDEPGDDDELYNEARKVVVAAGKASTSYIQRKLRVGYSRAARLIDLLEERGVVGPADGSKPRDVIGAGTQSSGPQPTNYDIEEDEQF
ncbi:MAG: DNA translocase FtsK 4TM domain-containing protein [Candidatus Pacebacteria bacterium]|nr:DNA translocase FtsK 4TM domain-containing protein [Candidatus Paceibacterota bacterium]